MERHDLLNRLRRDGEFPDDFGGRVECCRDLKGLIKEMLGFAVGDDEEDGGVDGDDEDGSQDHETKRLSCPELRERIERLKAGMIGGL